MRKGSAVKAYLALSAVSAALLLLVSFFGAREGASLSQVARWAVGMAFAASCLAGVVLSLRPRALRCAAHGEGGGPARAASGRRPRTGHHPDCDRFREHVIVVRGRARCAGCLGLATGSVLALAAIIAFLLAPGPSRSLGAPLLLTGLVLVGIGFAETACHSRHGPFHVIANALLVTGFFFAVVGVMTATADWIFGLMALIVCFLWMDTRVEISDWKHGEVCAGCPEGCKSY